MGSLELIAALREEGARKAQAIREQTEAAVGRTREEAAQRLACLVQEMACQEARAVEVEVRGILAEAGRQAQRLRLAGRQRLAQRLRTRAFALLPELRERDYPELFARMAAELPPWQWETVRVHPADLGQARELFPGAAVEPAPSISGGLEGWAQKGELGVDNTLEKRLERSWSELLPDILQEAEKHG